MRFLALVVVSVVLNAHAVAQEKSKAAQTSSSHSQPKGPETPHLEFVIVYIQELAAVERIRADGEEENKQATKDGKLPFAGMIHTATLFDLELSSQIRRLSDMRLDSPSDYLLPTIIDFYEQKLKIWRRMGEIGSTFMAGPKEGVDYGQLGAELPKLRAQLEYVDQSLFEATQGVFVTLIDTKPDSKGHVSHLIITKEEKAALLSKLNDSFGEKLNQKNPNYVVGAASLLKDYLKKDFKCSDEPLE